MDWINLLRKAVQAEGSQAAVASRLGYSPATVSRVMSDSYPGSVEAIREKVLSVYGGAMQKAAIPDGYMENTIGHLVPIESVKEVDLARDEFVRDLVRKAEELAKVMGGFKARTQADIDAFVELSMEKYGVQRRGTKGNLMLTTFDGSCKVLCDVSDQLAFDERLLAAKELIDDCLREWTRDSGAEVRALIDDAFQVDKRGRINARRILALRRLNITHPKWLVAMEAIGDAVTITGSKAYLRFYRRDERGQYHQIPLDMAAL